MSEALSEAERRTIARILKVNHAGECGAIRIYGAQIGLARRLFPDIAPVLIEMRDHEIRHRDLFAAAMPSRAARPCRALWLWGIGGWLLGLGTALLGRRAIWSCTAAVEETVHRHLDDQLFFLDRCDPELATLILSIREEEIGHLRHAEAQLPTADRFQHALLGVIGAATNVLIWLSTQGDSSRMARDLRAFRAADSSKT